MKVKFKDWQFTFKPKAKTIFFFCRRKVVPIKNYKLYYLAEHRKNYEGRVFSISHFAEQGLKIENFGLFLLSEFLQIGFLFITK